MALTASLSRREMLRCALREVSLERTAQPPNPSTSPSLLEKSTPHPATVGDAVMSICTVASKTGQEPVSSRIRVQESCALKRQEASRPPNTPRSSAQAGQGSVVSCLSVGSRGEGCTKKMKFADRVSAPANDSFHVQVRPRRSMISRGSAELIEQQARGKKAQQPKAGATPVFCDVGVTGQLAQPSSDNSTLRQLGPRTGDTDKPAIDPQPDSENRHDGLSQRGAHTPGADCRPRPSDATLPGKSDLEQGDISEEEKSGLTTAERSSTNFPGVRAASSGDPPAALATAQARRKVSGTQAEMVCEAPVPSPEQLDRPTLDVQRTDGIPSTPPASPDRLTPAQATENPLSRTKGPGREASELRQGWQTTAFFPGHLCARPVSQQQHVQGIENLSRLAVLLQEQHARGMALRTSVGPSSRQPTARPGLSLYTSPGTFQAASTSVAAPSTHHAWGTVPTDNPASHSSPVSLTSTLNTSIETPSWPGVLAQRTASTRAAWHRGTDPRALLWPHPPASQSQVPHQQPRAASQERHVAEQAVTSPQIFQGYKALVHQAPANSPLCQPQPTKDASSRMEVEEPRPSPSNDAVPMQQKRLALAPFQHEAAAGSQVPAVAQPKPPGVSRTICYQKDSVAAGPCPGSQQITTWPRQASPSVHAGHLQLGETPLHGQTETRLRLPVLPQFPGHRNWSHLQQLYGHQQSQADTVRHLPVQTLLAGASELNAGPGQGHLQTLVEPPPQAWKASVALPNCAPPHFLMPAPVARLSRPNGQKLTQAGQRGPQVFQGSEQKAFCHQKRTGPTNVPAGGATEPPTCASMTDAASDPPRQTSVARTESRATPVLNHSRDLGAGFSPPRCDTTSNHGPGVPLTSPVPSAASPSLLVSQMSRTSPLNEFSPELAASPCTGSGVVQPPLTLTCPAALPTEGENTRGRAAFTRAASESARIDADMGRLCTKEGSGYPSHRFPDRVCGPALQPQLQAQQVHAPLFPAATAARDHGLPTGVHQTPRAEKEPTITESQPQRCVPVEQPSALMQSGAQESPAQANTDENKPLEGQAEHPQQEKSGSPHLASLDAAKKGQQTLCDHSFPGHASVLASAVADPPPEIQTSSTEHASQRQDGGQHREEEKHRQERNSENEQSEMRAQAADAVGPRFPPGQRQNSRKACEPCEGQKSQAEGRTDVPQDGLSVSRLRLDEADAEAFETEWTDQDGPAEDSTGKAGQRLLDGCAGCLEAKRAQTSQLRRQAHETSPRASCWIGATEAEVRKRNHPDPFSTPGVLPRPLASSVEGTEEGVNDDGNDALQDVSLKALGSNPPATQDLRHQGGGRAGVLFSEDRRPLSTRHYKQSPGPRSESPSLSSDSDTTVPATAIALPGREGGNIVASGTERKGAETEVRSDAGHEGLGHLVPLRSYDVFAEQSSRTDQRNRQREKGTAGEDEEPDAWGGGRPPKKALSQLSRQARTSCLMKRQS